MKKKHIATPVSLLLVLGLGACLATVTESFDYDVLEENGLPYIDLDNQADVVQPVDLTTDETFNDNKDKIDNVDRVMFKGAMFTRNTTDAVLDISFRQPADTDKGTPAGEWMPILVGIEIAGTTTEDAPHKITYDESEPLIKNFEAFQKLATTGQMDLKLEAAGGNDQVRVTKLVAYIVLSGG